MATFGVDVLDYANKYNGAYVKTLAIGGDRATRKEFKEFVLAYKSKPASTDITLNYDKNYAGTFTDSITLTDQSDYNKLRSQQSVLAGTTQYKISFTTSGNSAPELEEFFLIWDDKPTI
jgi:hypothetical protein